MTIFLFTSFSRRSQHQPSEEQKAGFGATFDLIDTAGQGYISLDELKDLFRQARSTCARMHTRTLSHARMRVQAQPENAHVHNYFAQP